MKRILFAFVPLLAVVLLAPVALAEDFFDPPWDVTYPTATYQAWEFSTNANPAFPEVDDNPYGDPWLTLSGNDLVTGGVEWSDTASGPHGTDTTAWHISDPAGGKIQITVYNYPPEGLYKEIFLQLTSSKSPPPGGVTSGSPGSTTQGGGSTQWPGSSPSGTKWYTYSFMITIPDNPAVEVITIDLPYSTWIDEIVIDTRCVQIPEPGTLALVGLGGLCLLRKRKKR